MNKLIFKYAIDVLLEIIFTFLFMYTFFMNYNSTLELILFCISLNFLIFYPVWVRMRCEEEYRKGNKNGD